MDVGHQSAAEAASAGVAEALVQRERETPQASSFLAEHMAMTTVHGRSMGQTARLKSGDLPCLSVLLYKMGYTVMANPDLGVR